MKLQALIVDDELDAAQALRLMLEKTCSQVKITGIATTALEAIKTLNREQVDVLFLDIEMPGGTGFDLLDLNGNAELFTIFTTAHHEYAIQAIRQGAGDYLLKPIDPDELVESVKRASEHFGRKNKNAVVVKSSPTLPVNAAGDILFLNKENILYIKADGRYSELHCQDGRHYTICKNIGEYEQELADDFFFRVHKSFLVNCRHIHRINASDGGFVEMSNQQAIEISKRKKAEFLRFLR